MRGVQTNIQFLKNIIANPEFVSGKANVDFIKDHPELFKYKPRQDRGTKVLAYIGDVVVNGNPDVKNLLDPQHRTCASPRSPHCQHHRAPPARHQEKLTS